MIRVRSGRKWGCGELLESRWVMAVEPLGVQGIVFGSPTSTPLVAQAEQVQASLFADLNLDGRSDLVYSRYDAKSLYVRLGLDGGNYSEPLTFPVAATANHLVAGDLNDDGLLDVVMGSDSQTVSFLSRRGQDGKWRDLVQAQAQSTLSTGLALGDLNGDGALDLIVGRTDRVDVRMGQGNGQFASAVRYTTEAGDRRVDLADLDGDQDLDLVIGTALAQGVSGQVTVLRNDGEGIFETQSAKFSIGHAPMTIRLADLDGNGKQDLVVGHNVQEDGNLSIWNGNGNGTFELTPRRFEVLGAPEVFAFADLNADGMLDLNVGHRGTFHHPINGNGPGGISILLSKPGGYHEAIRLSTPDAKAIDVRDVDGDGRLDLVTVDYTDITVHRARDPFAAATGAMSYHSTSRGNSHVAAGDVNGDGFADVVHLMKDYAQNVSGELRVYYGSASGELIPGPSRVVDALPNELYVGNFDSDAAVEVLWVQTLDFGSYELAFAELGTDGQWIKPVKTIFGGLWNTHAVFDADADGKLDLLGLDSANSAARVMFSRGDGTFRSGPAIPNSTSWGYPKVAAIDGDNFPDLLFSSDQGSYVYLANGDGTYRESFRTARAYVDMQLGDFDGDGKLDFADYVYDSPTIRLYLGDGTGNFPRTQNVNVGRNYFQLTTLDVDGDSLSDLLIDSTDGFQLARNTGVGFASFESYSLPYYANQYRSADVDGDGVRDLVVAPGLSFNATQTQFAILRGKAEGGLEPSVVYSFPTFSTTGLHLVDVSNHQRPHFLMPTFDGFLVVPNSPMTLPGDFDGDGLIRPADADLLCAAIMQGNNDEGFDLDGDNQVSSSDMDLFLAAIAKTTPGDVNLDGRFDSADLIALLQIGEYEDGVARNSRWSEGDFDCDGEFTTADLVVALRAGGYESN